MRNMTFTDDRALMFGMGFTMLMLILVFAVLMLLLIAVGIPWYFVIVAVAGVVVFQYFMADRILLSMADAREVTAEEEPKLHSMIERLTALADVPKPKKIAVIEQDAPNAFAAGRNPDNALIAVTRGLLSRVNDQELESILAHEVAHIRNRDTVVMTLAMIVTHLTQLLMFVLRWSFVIVGAITAALMVFGSRNAIAYIAVLLVALTLYLYMAIAYLVLATIHFFNYLFMLALSRCREYAADRVGATLTGSPLQLANALHRIDDEMNLFPEDDLRKLQTANAFLIVSAIRNSNFVMNLLSTHPNTDKRIAKLRDMHRTMESSTQ